MSEKRKKYYTYIIKCADETFYTGYTSDLERRLREHNQCRGPDIPGGEYR
ncbi:MAG: GIY-YIG nuclease family protein [Halanaerobiales bacterium]|jgi:putative endonuclease